jgi:hypothetical protein
VRIIVRFAHAARKGRQQKGGNRDINKW